MVFWSRSIEKGFDKKVPGPIRNFIYLPFMHSEGESQWSLQLLLLWHASHVGGQPVVLLHSLLNVSCVVQSFAFSWGRPVWLALSFSAPGWTGHRLTGCLLSCFLWLADLPTSTRAIELYEEFSKELPEGAVKVYTESTAKFARLHTDVIKRFGRFPHRNALLGRQSTPEEEEYLKEGGGF